MEQKREGKHLWRRDSWRGNMWMRATWEDCVRHNGSMASPHCGLYGTFWISRPSFSPSFLGLTYFLSYDFQQKSALDLWQAFLPHEGTHFGLNLIWLGFCLIGKEWLKFDWVSYLKFSSSPSPSPNMHALAHIPIRVLSHLESFFTSVECQMDFYP